MIAFVVDNRDVYGPEPICRVLPITPSTHHKHSRSDRIQRLSAQARQDVALRPTSRACSPDLAVYGMRKVWLQMMARALRVWTVPGDG